MFSLQISRTLVHSEFEIWLTLADLLVGLVDWGADERRFSVCPSYNALWPLPTALLAP